MFNIFRKREVFRREVIAGIIFALSLALLAYNEKVKEITNVKFLIIISDIGLIYFLIEVYIKKFGKSRVKHILKRISVRTVIIGIGLVLFLLSISYLHNEGGKRIIEMFSDHAWLEIASGFVIYALVEFKIEEYGSVPRFDGERDYLEILNGIANSTKTVRILDNDFSSFFEFPRNKKKHKLEKEKDKKLKEEENKKILKEKFIQCLKNLDFGEKMEILLLHPATPAAKQRNDDLQSPDFDLFEQINKGFLFLYEFLRELETPVPLENEVPMDKRKVRLRDKIDIKLFKTSYSIVFVAWDKNVNFSILQPDQKTDDATFKTVADTELAIYFQKNFKKILDTTSLILSDYMRLAVHFDAKDDPEKDIYWGNDNYAHDVPVFIGVEDGEEFNEKLKNYGPLNIHHDGEIRRAKIIEIPRSELLSNDSTNHDSITLYNYAIEQIIKKSGKPSRALKHIYQIKYANRHRIKLKDENFVYHHLKLRGYCHTPHQSYEIFLGTHIQEMLLSIYDFFKNFDKYINKSDQMNRPYRRIAVGYTCIIKGETVVITNEKGHSHEGLSAKMSILDIPREDKHVAFTPIDRFLHTTIDADIKRILPRNSDAVKESQDVPMIFEVTVLLIQTKVNEEVPEVDPKIFSDEYSPEENKATYTVLHCAGKKFISGGMPMIFIDRQKEKPSKPVRIYNVFTTLDSVYVKNKHGEKKIELLASNMSFNKDEYSLKKKQALELEPNGYRNIIVVEFLKI